MAVAVLNSRSDSRQIDAERATLPAAVASITLTAKDEYFASTSIREPNLYVFKPPLSRNVVIAAVFKLTKDNATLDPHPKFIARLHACTPSSQPGQSLYSLATSSPPNPQSAFAGSPEQFGQSNDPLVGKPIGGVVRGI